MAAAWENWTVQSSPSPEKVCFHTWHLIFDCCLLSHLFWQEKKNKKLPHCFRLDCLESSRWYARWNVAFFVWAWKCFSYLIFMLGFRSQGPSCHLWVNIYSIWGSKMSLYHISNTEQPFLFQATCSLLCFIIFVWTVFKVGIIGLVSIREIIILFSTIAPPQKNKKQKKTSVTNH